MASINPPLRIEPFLQWPPTRKIVPAIDAPPPPCPKGEQYPDRHRSVIMMIRPLCQIHLMATRAFHEQKV